jgi:NADH:ubiquinone oxidoreductase subunit 6 (subunit J)
MSDLQQYGPVLLIAALGLAGVYLLLPRVRDAKPIAGAVLGAVALVLAGWLLIHNGTPGESGSPPLPETILFYAFSALAILGGGLMLSQRNPVHAALSFALVVLSTCGLFLLLAAPFLMAATIIVYAGAIIVTFLFVIMLAQQAGLTSADQRSREPFLASLGGFVLMGALLCVLQKAYDTSKVDDVLPKVRKVAYANSPEEIKAVLGDPAKLDIGKKRLPFLEDLHTAFPTFGDAKLDNAEDYLNQSPMAVQKLKTLFKEIYEHGLRVRGSLAAPDDMKLSPFSGIPANAKLPEGKTARELPARTVAGLGRTLFTDYLLPVELAGTLLLVASIGAIAIAGRRTEGLR